MKELLDKIDQIETGAINRIQKMCGTPTCSCEMAATRTIEEMILKIRKTLNAHKGTLTNE